MGVYLMGVRLERVPHGRAPRACISWACTSGVYLGRTYVIAAFGGRWPGVAFLILALSGKLALGPIASGTQATLFRRARLSKALPRKCQDCWLPFRLHVR